MGLDDATFDALIAATPSRETFARLGELRRFKTRKIDLNKAVDLAQIALGNSALGTYIRQELLTVDAERVEAYARMPVSNDFTKPLRIIDSLRRSQNGIETAPDLHLLLHCHLPQSAKSEEEIRIGAQRRRDIAMLRSFAAGFRDSPTMKQLQDIIQRGDSVLAEQARLLLGTTSH
jgi:hypothetical protein